MTQFLFNILISGTASLMAAISLSIIYFTTRIFHVGQAGLIILGAYLQIFFINHFNFSFLTSGVLAILVTAGIGLFIEVFIFKPMRIQNASPLVLFLVSLGLYIVFVNGIAISFGDDLMMSYTGPVKSGKAVAGGFITLIQLVSILIVLLSTLLQYGIIRWTAYGRMVKAIASDPQLSAMHGIRVDRVIAAVFYCGSALGAIAGMIYAADYGISLNSGFGLLINGTLIMLISGFGNYRDLWVSAFSYAALQNIAALLFGSNLAQPIGYAIVLIFLLVRPAGINGESITKTSV